MKTNEMMNEAMAPVQEAEALVVRDELAGGALAFSLDMLNDVQNNFLCSIPDDGSRKAKVAIYNAIQNAERKVDDYINKELKITDVVVHPIEVVDEQTGEVKQMLRTILIDVDGNGYAAVSYGVLTSLQKIFGIVGKPSWKDEPLTIMPKKDTTRNGYKVTTLALV